jgi:hypothetical protein
MNLLSPVFWGVNNPAFMEGIQQAVDNIHPDGIYAGDNILTFGRNLGFLENKDFVDAWKAHAETEVEHAIVWRIYVLAWAAKSVLSRKIPGDFVECPCNQGTIARIVCDYVDFAHSGRNYYLYDLFEQGKNLLSTVKNRFSQFSNLIIANGVVPQVLDAVAPGKISFMHVGMGDATAEIGVLERLFDRLSPGGILVLNNYGWLGYREQMLAEDPWLAERGYEVLELPTGQGLLIK